MLIICSLLLLLSSEILCMPSHTMFEYLHTLTGKSAASHTCEHWHLLQSARSASTYYKSRFQITIRGRARVFACVWVDGLWKHNIHEGTQITKVPFHFHGIPYSMRALVVRLLLMLLRKCDVAQMVLLLLLRAYHHTHPSAHSTHNSIITAHSVEYVEMCESASCCRDLSVSTKQKHQHFRRANFTLSRPTPIV